MITIASAVNLQEKDVGIPFFKGHVMEEEIIKSKGIKTIKENGYVRYYYPSSGVIEEISSTGLKVRFLFDKDAFKRLEDKNPRAAAIFYKYNAEIFESASCDITHLAKLYDSTLERIRAELYEAEREVFKNFHIISPKEKI